MAIIPIRDIPTTITPTKTAYLAVDNGVTMGKATVQSVVDARAPELITNAINALNLGTASQENVEAFATAAQGAKADTAVQPTRTVSAGSGLTGGGTLASNITLALSSTSLTSLARADSAVQPARTISAGTGLSGGGDLSADRTLSLSAAAQASLAKADSALQAPGGAAGQVLTKLSATTNDVGWQTVAAATAVSYGPQTLTAAQQAQARANIGFDGSVTGIGDARYLALTGGTITGPIVSKTTNALRIANNGKSVILHKNVSQMHVLLSDSEDGPANALRPLWIDLTNGRVHMDAGVDVIGTTNVTGDTRIVGNVKATGTVSSADGAATLAANGNVTGPVWVPWGANDAATAIDNRITFKIDALVYKGSDAAEVNFPVGHCVLVYMEGVNQIPRNAAGVIQIGPQTFTYSLASGSGPRLSGVYRMRGGGNILALAQRVE
jgi:hypothetical protein